MNPAEITDTLRRHLAVCREIHALCLEENAALNSPQPWSPEPFAGKRKRLLPQLESVLIHLRSGRERWLALSAAERIRCGEILQLLQEIQGLLPKILLLDRENQQAMLRRGVVPAPQVTTVAQAAGAGGRPHFVASLYQRHAAS